MIATKKLSEQPPDNIVMFPPNTHVIITSPMSLPIENTIGW